MPKNIRTLIGLGIFVAVILHMIVITLISIAAFFTFEAYIWSIIGLLPISLVMGGFAGIITRWINLSRQTIFLAILVLIGFVVAFSTATFTAQFLDADNRYMYVTISALAAITGGIIAELAIVSFVYTVQYLLQRQDLID
ncbi:MAG: hypothetical protein KDE50_20895 [Caldilineaceae bacterium]|nr:hypothetical protein [Caldilineaceae bacterium]MCB0142371.1 hypothetical protein [Caldilineaceae bacterium]